MKRTTSQRKFHNSNITLFNELLCSQDWSPVYTEPGINKSEQDFVNICYNAFASIFFSCFEMAFPKTRTNHNSNKTNKNWITKGIIKSSETKMVLYKNMIKQGDIISRDHYNKYKKCLNKVVKEAKNSLMIIISKITKIN